MEREGIPKLLSETSINATTKQEKIKTAILKRSL
jgi:hypothetical protein